MVWEGSAPPAEPAADVEHALPGEERQHDRIEIRPGRAHVADAIEVALLRRRLYPPAVWQLQSKLLLTAHYAYTPVTVKLETREFCRAARAYRDWTITGVDFDRDVYWPHRLAFKAATSPTSHSSIRTCA